MMGHHFGVPYHRELQCRVILEALDFLTTARMSGDVKMLPLKWATARSEGIEIEKNRIKLIGT
jgi:hypothetical protein